MVDTRISEAFADGSINSTACPYVTPAYLAESRDAAAIGAILFLFCLTTITVLLRIISRLFLVRSFGLDDYLALLGFALFVAFTTLGIALIRAGSGRHIEYIQFVLTPHEVDRTEVGDYAAHLVYTTALFVCRLSGLAFFRRLCTSHETLLRIVMVAAGFLVCCFLPQFFLILFHCSPVTGLWPYAWQSGYADYNCLSWGVVYVTNSALSLVCDVVMFTIPVAILSIIKLSKERKIMLAFLLLPGTLVILISCVRLWLCVVGQWRVDGSWYYNPQLAIETAEIGGTLIAISIPGLKALVGTVYARMRSTVDRTHPRTGHGKMSHALGTGAGGVHVHANGSAHRPSDWHSKSAFDARASLRGSDSDEDLLAPIGSSRVFTPRDVGVQREMTTTVPMAHLKRRQSMVQRSYS